MTTKNKQSFTYREQTTSAKNQFKTTPPIFYQHHPAFSFKHYEHGHKRYSVKCIANVKDFYTIFERLRAMSQLKWKDIVDAPDTYHFHIIEWKYSSEPSGFKHLSSEFKEEPTALQFKVFRECRAVGFFNTKNIFELIWIDRDHKVYRRK